MEKHMVRQYIRILKELQNVLVEETYIPWTIFEKALKILDKISINDQENLTNKETPLAFWTKICTLLNFKYYILLKKSAFCKFFFIPEM